jgi:hypothetical protein
MRMAYIAFCVRGRLLHSGLKMKQNTSTVKLLCNDHPWDMGPEKSIIFLSKITKFKEN